MIDSSNLAATVATSLTASSSGKFSTLPATKRRARTVQCSWLATQNMTVDDVATHVIASLTASGPFTAKKYSVQVDGDGSSGTVYVTEVG